MFSENISASTGCGKEIICLLKKKMMMKKNNYCDDTKIMNSRMSRFLRAKLKACMNALGLCIARGGPDTSCCWCV